MSTTDARDNLDHFLEPLISPWLLSFKWCNTQLTEKTTGLFSAGPFSLQSSRERTKRALILFVSLIVAAAIVVVVAILRRRQNRAVSGERLFFFFFCFLPRKWQLSSSRVDDDRETIRSLPFLLASPSLYFTQFS